jgi:hypothetical protein
LDGHAFVRIGNSNNRGKWELYFRHHSPSEAHSIWKDQMESLRIER